MIANDKATSVKKKATTGNGRKAARKKAKKTPITIERRYTVPGIHPYDGISWERRDAVITNEDGEVIFEQHGVEIPASWSQLATNVVVSKYFKGAVDRPGRETSAREIVDRVVRTLRGWGESDGILATPEDGDLHRGLFFTTPSSPS